MPLPVPALAHCALRFAGLVAVLVGLLGMHGLSGSGGHGAAGMSMQSVQPALMASSPMSMELSGLAIPTEIVSEAGLSVRHQTEDLLESAAAYAHMSDTGGMVMGVMCLAILGAALLAVLQLLLRARVAAVVWSLPRSVRAIVPRGRDPDPPSLIKLSIQRC